MSDHPATETLRQFAGTIIRGPNAHFRIDELSDGDWPDIMDQVEQLERAAAEKLICIGEIDGGHGNLFQGQSGRCFAVYSVAPIIAFVGATADEMIERIKAGVRHRPILLQGQDEQAFYGEIIRSGDPRIYEL